MQPIVAILARWFDAYRAFADRNPTWVVLPLWLFPIFGVVAVGGILPSILFVPLLLLVSAHCVIMMIAHHNSDREPRG